MAFTHYSMAFCGAQPDELTGHWVVLCKKGYTERIHEVRVVVASIAAIFGLQADACRICSILIAQK